MNLKTGFVTSLSIACFAAVSLVAATRQAQAQGPRERPAPRVGDVDLHIRTQFSVLQSQFGITPFTKLLGTIGVADKLTIYGDAWIYGR
jgi:hypothetical protein